MVQIEKSIGCQDKPSDFQVVDRHYVPKRSWYDFRGPISACPPPPSVHIKFPRQSLFSEGWASQTSQQHINIQSHWTPVASLTTLLVQRVDFSSWYLWEGQSWMSLRWGRGCVEGGGGGVRRLLGGDDPLSLCKHNNNSSNTLLAALLMYFQAKTGIFASCVIYCGSHLHIKALISPSERVCAPVCVFVCEWGAGGVVV